MYTTLLDRDVAIKVLTNPRLGQGRPRPAAEQSARGRPPEPPEHRLDLLAEASNCGQVTPFIVMELVQVSHWTLAETVGIGGQGCAALDHAHSHVIYW